LEVQVIKETKGVLVNATEKWIMKEGSVKEWIVEWVFRVFPVKCGWRGPYSIVVIGLENY